MVGCAVEIGRALRRAGLDSAGELHSRVDYTPYGVAMHSYAADLNGNGTIDGTDMGLFLTNLNSGSPLEPGDANYDPYADLNGDGLLGGTATDEFNAFNARYSAYSTGGSGNPTVNAGWIDNPTDAGGPDNSVGYDGYWFDLAGAVDNGSTGLYMVRHRVYDPGMGRWGERDPLIIFAHRIDMTNEPGAFSTTGEYTQSWGKDFANSQQYARVNPLGRLDPSGMKCCIALRCSNIKKLGIIVGSHCGLVFCEDEGCFSYDGSGGPVHMPGIHEFDLDNPPLGVHVGQMNCGFPDSVCDCLRSEQRRWQLMSIPRDHTCANSNWHLRCVTTKCKIDIFWGSGMHRKPIGWDCPGYVSGYTCEGNDPYHPVHFGPTHSPAKAIIEPCP